MPKKRRVLSDPFKDTGGEPRPPLCLSTPSPGLFLYTLVVPALCVCVCFNCLMKEATPHWQHDEHIAPGVKG